jgi:hypothetical protein
MNWGTKIVLSFVLFAGFVFTLVYKMLTSGNDLVAKEYYRSGKQVNAELKLRDSSSVLQNAFSIDVLSEGQESIVLKFKNAGLKPEGNVVLTCLSSDKADQKETLALVSNGSEQLQTIRLKKFEAGNWLCEIRGNQGSQDFVVKSEFRIYKSQPAN